MSTRSAPRKVKGFSLIELLIAMAVGAILVAVALPAMTGTIERNRMATQANEFVAAVALARTEAIRRNAAGGICASSNQLTCGGTWQEGYIAWVDGDRDGIADAGEALRTGSFNTQDTATALVTNIQFNARGRRILPAFGSGPVFVDIQPSSCTAGTVGGARGLAISTTGGVTVSKKSCI